MRILWHSVAPWAPTGYGQQTGQAVPRIGRQGHDVAISAFYGHQGGMRTWTDPYGHVTPIYPPYNEQVGVDALLPNAVDWFTRGTDASNLDAIRRGLIITLYDVWRLEVPNLFDFNCAAWTPIDHITCPDIVRDWFRRFRAVPIAMSRFGQQAIEAAGLEALYVPHGIDTTVFRPGDRTEARDRTGIPHDRFVIALVAANVGRDGNRKAFAEQLSAFAMFRHRHPDAFLVIHTDVRSPVGSDVARFLAELPDDSYLVTDQTAYRRGLVTAEHLADLYRSADVLTNTSWGEGFGICIVEAQACGTPVVVTDATAMPELCGAGWKVGYEPLWHDSQAAWAAKPLIGEIVAAYEDAYDNASKLRDDAAAFGQLYDADFIADTYWRTALEQIEAGISAQAEAFTGPVDPLMMPATVRPADGLLWFDRGAGTEDSMGWGDHEKVLQPVLEGLLPDGGVFMDVGAHVGHWSLRLAKKASQVVSVEANHDTATILRRNIALNDLADKITVHNFAAWDEPAFLRLSDPHHHLAGGSTRTLLIDDDHVDDELTCAVRLDNQFADIPHVDLIKLDVEGADIRALEGMRGLLERCSPALFIERHDMYGYYELADLEAKLRSLGYRWEPVAEWVNSVYLLAVKDG